MIYAKGDVNHRRWDWWISLPCLGERDRELRRRLEESVSKTALSRPLSLLIVRRNRFIASTSSVVPS